jgi:ABC-type transport system involved in cytochrome bd biosynthesis fused ATPase/permease subunit
MIGRLLGLLRPALPLVVVSAACRVAGQGLGVTILALGAAAVTGRPGLVGWMALLAVLKGGLRYLEQLTGHAVAFRLLSRLRIQVYRGLGRRLPDPHLPSGRLIGTLTDDVDRLEPVYAHLVAPVVSGLVVPLAGWGVLMVIHPGLAGALAPALLIGWTAPLWKANTRLTDELRSTAGLASAEITETVQGLRDVVLMGAEQMRADRLREISGRLTDLRLRLAHVASFRTAVSELAAGIGLVAVAAAGYGLLSSGSVSTEGLAVAVAVTWGVFGPVRALEGLVPDLAEAVASARRVFELIDSPSPTSGPGSPPPVRHHLAVERVVFGYRPERPILDGFDLTVGEGEKVAIMGASGSGKSTLVGLLAGWWTPQAGRIRVGDVDLARLGEDERSRLFAVVEQRPHLVWGTVADNLRLAGDPTPEDMARVLDSLGARFGLDTPIGELGTGLSGGERRLVAVARALLRPAPILVLDEPTNGLDVDTERRVLDVLLGLDDRTVLVVAHLVRVVRHFERVVVLEGGRVQEDGPYSELLERGGVLAALAAREADLLA